MRPALALPVLILSLLGLALIITAMIYQPRKPGRAPTAIHDQHRGEVRPHPELHIVRDGSGRLTTIHANLALIFLEQPVQDVAPPPGLADSEARLDEPLITVGYGNDESGAALHGERRFNTSRVVSLPEDRERIILSPPRQPLYQDDSREWLREQLLEAAQPK